MCVSVSVKVSVYPIGIVLKVVCLEGLQPWGFAGELLLSHSGFCKSKGLGTFPRAPPRYWGPAATYPRAGGREPF